MRGMATEGPYSRIDIRLGRLAEAGSRLMALDTPSMSKPRRIGHSLGLLEVIFGLLWVIVMGAGCITLTLALSLRERGLPPGHSPSLDSCLRRNDGGGLVGEEISGNGIMTW